MKTKPEITKNNSTEEKIKEAARHVFTQKGYAGTRTRDIAEASGFNLALINYYFRSKEKLFDIIMLERLQTFMHGVIPILNDSRTTLQQKIEIWVTGYIDMLIKNPDLPLFVLREVHADPGKFVSKIGFNPEHTKLYLVQQWQEYVVIQKKPTVLPIHILINIASMTIFPFLASPMLKNRTGMSTAAFNKLMEERKKLIPIWVAAIMNAV
jgi:AcrR family transcriptional regulator